MSSGKTIKKAAVVVAIAGYTLSALVTAIAHAQSKINVFSNPNVFPDLTFPLESVQFLY